MKKWKFGIIYLQKPCESYSPSVAIVFALVLHLTQVQCAVDLTQFYWSRPASLGLKNKQDTH